MTLLFFKEIQIANDTGVNIYKIYTYFFQQNLPLHLANNTSRMLMVARKPTCIIKLFLFCLWWDVNKIEHAIIK